MLAALLNRTMIVLLALGSAGLVVRPGAASDHGDTPELIAAGSHDARLADLYAFTHDGRLVLALCSNPAIPAGQETYTYPRDLRLAIFVDKTSEVRFDDPDDLSTLGGTIVEPKQLHRDVAFLLEFDHEGIVQLKVKGIDKKRTSEIRLFAGLRDDPFIRGPRIGRNIAAVVLEMPIDLVTDASHPALLIWAVSRMDGADGPFQDLTGRALRSQFPENNVMNTTHPHKHEKTVGGPPDVMIYDTSRPAGFPNGRKLTDDVVDLVGDARVLANDQPFPVANEVPFLDEFPYLAPPHLP